MKKFLLLAVAAMMPVFMMAHVNGNGSTRANAIDFSWDNGHVQQGSKTLWYKVSLDSLYKQENPALALSLTSQSAVDTVQVSVEAYIGATSTTPQATKEYKLLPSKQMSWNMNAAILVRMKIDTVYIKLKTITKLDETAVKLSAQVYDSGVDLDETCKEAKPFKWSGITQAAGATQKYKVDLTAAKAAANKDVKIAITNNGSGDLHLIAEQSMDCPSTGLTRHECIIPSHQTVYDTIPQDVIKSMFPDELYVQFDNDQPIKVSAELIAASASSIYSGTPVDLHVDANLTIEPGDHFFRISVSEMNSMVRFEPEFTFRNNGEADADIVRRMSFSNPVMGWQSSEVVLPAGGEFTEVIKKNVLQAINTEIAPYIYILIKNDQPFQLVGRFKNVREGKACKSNIDFDWEKGHAQEAKTTQWYAIDVTDAKKTVSDIHVVVENLGYADATVTGALAFSCPYIDLQTATRTIKLSKPSETTINYSSYAMMTDTVWIGITTDQDIHFSAEMIPAKTKPLDPNDPCLQAEPFDWENGVVVEAGVPKWIKVDMREVRDLQEFPTLHITNLSAKEVTIKGELSLECPDTIENQARKLTIAANDTYTKKISRNMFENIKVDSVYIRVEATQDIYARLRFTDDSEGTTCGSAVDFNWKVGNDQKADENIWYAVNLIDAIESKSDMKVTIVNKDNKECKGTASIAYECADEILQEVNFTLDAKQTKSKVIPFSSLELLTDHQIFVNLKGNTALHIQAELVPAEKLATPITCDDLAGAKKLEWNTEYTQLSGNDWYKLDRNILDSLLDGKKTAEARVWNESGAEQEITAEVAFACPIEYKMAQRTVTLKNGKELVKAIEANTAQQLSTKEVVFVRLTSTGAIKFQARLIAARDGRDRAHAIDFEYNKAYAQEANTTVWYRVNTSDLKNIEDVDGARLFAEAKMPEANTTVEVAIFEENSDQDLIDYFTGRKAKHTFEKPHSRKHHVPAYVVRALADDKTVYARVTTDKPLSGRTELSRYNKLAEGKGIPTKKLATLAVPNVDYSIPGGKGQWFAVCVKDLKENFELTNDAGFSITNPNADSITVTGTATWQDSLTYDIPYRTRGINKGVRSYTMTFIEAAEKAAKRKGHDISLEGLNLLLVDSFARAYSTDEHLAAYVYIEHDGAQPIQVRLKLKPKTGDEMTNPIAYDWEHGNVNPGKANEAVDPYGRAKNWFMVELNEDNVPKDKDLELQITNWSKTETSTTKATIKIDELADLDGKTIEVEIAPGEKKTKRIDRTLLLGMSNIFIEFESSQANYIWTEFVDTLKRDTIDTYEDHVECLGHFTFDSEVCHFEGDLTSNLDTLRFEEKWEVVRDDEKGVHKCDSIVHHKVFALKNPDLIKIKDIKADVYTTAASTWLKNELNKSSEADKTYKEITGIVWEIATNNANTQFKIVPEAKLKNEAIVLRYGAITECENDTLFSDLFFNTFRDTLKASDCYEYKWAANDSTYHVSTLDSIEGTEPNGCKSIHYLDVTIKSPIAFNVEALSKYGNRLIVINRDSLDKKMGFKSDSIYDKKGTILKIEWYEVSKPETIIAEDYFFNDPKGEPLVGTFQAKITLKVEGAECDKIGYTNELVCKPSNAAAPALVPNLVMPGENINVINLDPTKETMLRIYSTDGMLRNTYFVRGQETFTMPAAADHGFYLVELYNDDLKTTLRYIVK